MEVAEISSVVVPHIIGTTSIIAMILAVGLFYNGFFITMHSEVYKVQLGQVTDYVASNIMDLVTLSRLTQGDLFLVKVIEPPTFIGEKVYNVSIISMTIADDKEVIRCLALIDSPNIHTVSDLPWSLNNNTDIYTGQNITHPDNVFLQIQLTGNAAVSWSVKEKVYASMIVWCSKTGDNITIGMGIMERG